MKTLVRSTWIVLAAAFVLAGTQRADAQNRRSRSQTSEYNTFESLNNGRRDFRNAMIAKQGYEPNPSSYGYVDVSDDRGYEPRRNNRQNSAIKQASYRNDSFNQGSQASYSDQGEGYCDTCNYSYESCCCDCRPWWAHRTGMFGEYLYLTATDADVTHGQQQDGVGGSGTVPSGRIGTVDPGYEDAFRVGFDLGINDCSSLFFSYTHFESSASDHLEIPNITGGGGSIASYVHHPGATLTASAGPLDVDYDIDFQLADFGVRRMWRAGPRHIVNWSVGGRYGHLEQDFLQSGIFSGGLGQVFTRTNVDFDGGGLRFGLDGERRFGCRGFSLYGKANLATMVGTIQADYYSEDGNTIQRGDAVWKDDRMVAVLDYEAGFSWTGPCERWKFSTGYHVAHWFNMVTTDSWIEAVKANNYEDVDGPLSFSGLVARFERRF